MYPRLEININKLIHNSNKVLSLLKDNDINSCFLVSKVLAGDVKIVGELFGLGFTHLADSRIENLQDFCDFNIPKVLLRLPMASQIEKVIKYSNISLNSEIDTIRKLDEEARRQNKIHQIILMFDLGDLREGIFYKSDYLVMVGEILKLTNISLVGLGTNLTCYGGVLPSSKNLTELVKIKNNIEAIFKIELSIISGGNSSMIHLLSKDIIPKEINNLRIGEAIFLARETAYGDLIEDMFDDAFILKTEIIELANKPSYPIGQIGLDSFGMVPKINDQGYMNRAILGIGKQDIVLDNLYPVDNNVKIIGGSSDHLIIEANPPYKLGDIISFKVNYPGLLQLMTSKYVQKKYIDK